MRRTGRWVMSTPSCAATLRVALAGSALLIAALCMAQTPLGEAIAAYKQGDLQRAATLFAQAAQGEQDLAARAAIRLKLAWVQFQMNDQVKARETLRAAFTDDSDLSVPEGHYSRDFVRMFHETKGAVVSPWSYSYDAQCDCKPGIVYAMAKSRSDVYCGANDSQFCFQFQLSPKGLTAPGQVTIDFAYDRLVSKGAGGAWTTSKEQARITDTVNPNEMYKYATHSITLHNTSPRDQIRNITITSIACNSPGSQAKPTTPAAAPEPPSAECRELTSQVRRHCGNPDLDLGEPCSVLQQARGPGEHCCGWIGQFVGPSFTWGWWIIRAKACVTLLQRCAQVPGCKSECDRLERDLLPEILRKTHCSSAGDVLRFDCLEYNRLEGQYPLCRLGSR